MERTGGSWWLASCGSFSHLLWAAVLWCGCSVKSLESSPSEREPASNVCQNVADLRGVGLKSAVELLQQSARLLSGPVGRGEKRLMRGGRERLDVTLPRSESSELNSSQHALCWPVCCPDNAVCL